MTRGEFFGLVKRGAPSNNQSTLPPTDTIDKTRVMPAKIFPHLKLKCWLFIAKNSFDLIWCFLQ